MAKTNGGGPPGPGAAEHFDVLVVGAGISGVDAAWHLQNRCPGKSFALLEAREEIGGTWFVHRFPGIRSDSDLFTFGYGWKPWSGPAIATAEEILAYLNETVDEHGIRRHIRFRHEVNAASWDSAARRWTLRARRADTGESREFTCNFLWMCQGYYRHAEGYTPDFPGMARFRGRIVHPQTWPGDLDHSGKRVVVIGSGATAATLIPALARDCAHVTMLQRSPTFYYPRPTRDELAETLRGLDLPEEWTHEILRRKFLRDQRETARRSFEEPDALRRDLIAGVKAYLGDGYDVETHFTPRYRPWRQRLAVTPDGDLFRSIRAGRVSVVTDEVDSFTEDGVRAKSGAVLAADVVVTATGFDLCAFGGVPFAVDGAPVDFAECIGHRGILFTGVPNMAWVFGYLRTSWTMRADLVSAFVCRLLNHMAGKGADMVTARLRAEDRGMTLRPFIESENFNPGYVTRSVHLMPKQGDREPWVFSQDYFTEKDTIPGADLEDGALVYA